MKWRTTRAYGLPAPQGSKKILNGRLVESSAAVAPWRQAVTYAAVEDGGEPLAGPIEVMITFLLPRPKTAPKRRLWPDKKPDLDKLIRSTFDALTDARAWEDDAQVCRVLAEKTFAGPDQPIGAHIHIRQISEEAQA